MTVSAIAEPASATPEHDRPVPYRSVWRDLIDVPLQQAFVDAGGVRTRYLHAGDAAAPALILVHGTGGSWETFCSNIGPLSQHFSVYAFDMLGAGFTDKPDRPYEIADYGKHLTDFMDALGVERASFIGCSLGAWVIARLALTAPERIDRLVLISAAGLKQLPASFRQGFETRRASIDDPSWDNIAATLGNLLYSRRMPDDLISVRQRIYEQPAVKRVAGNLLAMADPETRERNNLKPDEWRAIRAPTLVIAHKDSPNMWLETSYEIANLIPDVTLVEMGEVDHWAHFERPEDFNRIAIDFLTHGKV